MLTQVINGINHLRSDRINNVIADFRRLTGFT